MAMIDVVNCTQHYGVRPVLRDITLHIERGEIVALMGPNGMGKSTLMAVMAGVLPPARGYVEIDGRRRRRTIEEEATVRKMVAYLPADSWLPAQLSGREWLLAVGRLYEHDDLHLMEHAEQLVGLFALADIIDSKLSSWSSGQRKKVALAAALITEAPVLLLDEPFAGGLDPSGILALKRVLRRLRDEKHATIVFATPVPEVVEELADRVAFLRDGKIVAFDSVDGLRRATGCPGKLDELYARLVSPDQDANIDRYFEKARQL